MSEGLEFADAPVLTLDPFPEKEEIAEEKKPAEPAWDDNILTEEERRMVEQFTSQIDLHNTNIVLQYDFRLICTIQISYCSTVRELRRKWRIFRKKPWKMFRLRIWEKSVTC